MGFWSRLFGRGGDETKMTSLELFREVYAAGRDSMAGVAVTTAAALEVSTVLACARVIAEGCSQIPFHLMQEAGGRKSIANDPLDDILYRRPNGFQTSFEFRETLLLHVILCGNAYVFINRVGSARRVRELLIIEPHRVEVKRLADFSLRYKVRNDDGSSREYGQEEIWHIRGPSWNTWMGLDAVKTARNAIGLAISLEQGQSEFQKNGAKQSGIVSVEGRLDKKKFEDLSAWLDRHRIGGDRAHAPLVIDMNGKFTPTAMTGVDQQLIETRNHQIVQICAHFRVLPIMVGHYDKAATYASAEQMFLHHVIHTLMPWYQRIEQSADVNLLTDAQRAAGMFTKLNPNALMRGAAKDQAEYFAKALGSGGGRGWMTQNEVRDALDVDRSDDPEAEKLPQPPAPSAPPAPSQG